MRDAGLQVLPILSWPSAEPDVEAMCGYAEWYVETFPDSQWVELGQRAVDSGQDSRRRVPAHRRTDGRGAARPRIPTCGWCCAMDLFDHVTGEERGWPGVDDVIACIASSDRRYADLHPYRNPYRRDVLAVALARQGVRRDRGAARA